MNKKTFLRILLISFSTTLFRELLQFFVPVSHQTVLKPSIFVKNGTLPLVFTIYATIAYMAISYIFLFLDKNMPGKALSKGIRFGLLFALMWAVYLTEPLPNSVFSDIIAYPLADGSALLLLGILLGKFVATNSHISYKPIKLRLLSSVPPVVLSFFIVRMFEYTIMHVYSSFYKYTVETVVWIFLTGIVIGIVFKCLISAIKGENIVIRAIKYGILVFGTNLIFFNCFMLIVADVDFPGMLLRTLMDVLSVTAGFFIALKLNKE